MGGKKIEWKCMREGKSESIRLDVYGAEQLFFCLMSGLLTTGLSLYQPHVLIKVGSQLQEREKST